MTGLRATYSPDDNKLRLYTAERLPSQTYDRLRQAGFVWAPKQVLYVAPMWTPQREDLLIELCGEIGDEDTTLVDRAEERADRFSEYGEKRATEAAGRDYFTAGRLWDQSVYWTDRAQAAIGHARYKESAPVRSRRIRRLEADLRKVERDRDRGAAAIARWNIGVLSLDAAKALADGHRKLYRFTLAEYPRQPPVDQSEDEMGLRSALVAGIITPDQARDLAVVGLNRAIGSCKRWIDHYENRLAYERGMLAAQGGTVADRTKPETGGACRSLWSPADCWSTIVKVNRISVTIRFVYREGERVFTRTVPFDKLSRVMSKAQVDAARAEGRVRDHSDGIGFYLTPAEPETTETDDRLAA